MRFLNAFLKRSPGLLILASIPVYSGTVSPDWQCQDGPRGWVCASAHQIEEQAAPLSVDKPGTIPTVPSAMVKPETVPAPTKTAIVAPAVQTKPDPQWRFCATKPEPTSRPSGNALDRADTPMTINADSVEFEENGDVIYEGNVNAVRADQQLRADTLTYHPATDVIIAAGNTHYQESGLAFDSPRTEIQLSNNTGTLESPTYHLPNRNGRGTADQIEIKSAAVTEYSNANYTTCELNDPVWQVKGKSITLDKAAGTAVARDVRLEVGSIPVLYSPYLRFPIDDRRLSGFLLPSVGSSDSLGANVTVPYYWNIAPNQDATITPRIMEKRGFMLAAKHRYLGKHFEGENTLQYLPSDQEDHRDRGLLNLQHTGRYASAWSSDVKIQYVSDNDYLDDFGTSLESSSPDRLERRVDLRYNQRHWSLLGRTQYFQTLVDGLVDTSKPYQRLPQIVFNGTLPTRPFKGVKASLRAEAVSFDRNDTVTGERLDLFPRIERRFQTAATYITPAMSVRHTQYWLDDPGDPTIDNESRTIPIFSLDSGVFFERDASWAGQAMQQTLEPRIFYLYAEPTDQSDIPVFDSSLPSFNFAELFQENRFSGTDRVGDANQMTVALTSRFINQTTGEEQLRATLGQIFYFRDRKVTLPGRTANTTSSSDIVADIYAKISPSWQVRSGLQWDPHNNRSEVGLAQLRYRSGQDHIANLTYRQRRGSLEHVDGSLRWPLGSQTHAVARWDYSLLENKTLEGLIGLEYESCCWLVRAIYEEHTVDPDAGDSEETSASFRIQFELKGLSSFGDDIGSRLSKQILGYRPDETFDTE